MSDVPKKPVSYDEVVETVESLRGEGIAKEQITGQLLRSRLGGRGSFSTLLKHRDSYYAELEKPEPEQFIGDGDLGTIRRVLNEVMGRKINIDRARAVIELQEAHSRIKALEAKIVDLEDVAAEKDESLVEAQDEASAARLAEERLTIRLAATEAALDEAREANRTLAGLLDRKGDRPKLDAMEETNGPADEQRKESGTDGEGSPSDHEVGAHISPAEEVADDAEDHFDDDLVFPLDGALPDYKEMQNGQRDQAPLPGIGDRSDTAA